MSLRGTRAPQGPRCIGILAVACAMASAAPSWAVSPQQLDRSRNRVRSRSHRVSAAAKSLHKRLEIADLHCDSLLWDRDLGVRHDYGHIDTPRLIEGGVALQVFASATVVPRSNGDDLIDLLAAAQGWRRVSRRGPLARALHLAARLHDAIGASQGGLSPILSRTDLAELARSRATRPVVGALLSLEGAHALDGDIGSLAKLDAAGYRMITLAHFTDNAFAGSAHGRRAHGLTPLGRQLVRQMEARGIVVDVSHASPKTIDDVLAISRHPVVASHTGVLGTCRDRRNLSDAQLEGIARSGGVIGIGFWRTAVCGTDTSAIVRAVRHAVSVAGIDHVGLGSDFDGSVTTPFDVAHLAVLTDALLAAGFGEPEIRKLMGKNVLRVLSTALPER